MVKVSVVSTKDIWKYIIKLGFAVIILFFIVKIYKYSKNHFGKAEITVEQCISYLTEEITVMGDTKTSKIFNINPTDIVGSELKISKVATSRSINSITLAQNMEDIENYSETIETSQNNIDMQLDENGEIEEISTEVNTVVIDSGIKTTYNFSLNSVQIKNETHYNLQEMNLNPNISINNNNILIFHTHTCESYTPTQANKYQSTGNYRTTDLNYTVSRVGDELEKYLKSYGYNVYHDKTYHDYPAYSGSYGRSLKTVSNLLSTYKDTDLVIDLHRDAMADESYAPKVKIGDEYVAQIMFVIGTNGSGLSHDNWKQNLEFAIKVQQKANELYPGLFKPILLRDARYNQHLAKAANIIEIGATGNTLEECEASARYLAKILDEVMK